MFFSNAYDITLNKAHLMNVFVTTYAASTEEEVSYSKKEEFFCTRIVENCCSMNNRQKECRENEVRKLVQKKTLVASMIIVFFSTFIVVHSTVIVLHVIPSPQMDVTVFYLLGTFVISRSRDRSR